ncbi:DUF262 domain-containing protein [Micrococcus luteus]|uniref:DUF262 domain-containing protein n=1 Tax=Micrococcus luteus TaxID=1270 RepID=UPI0021082486|nr:DUF262 domain-containing protein [Micrococcus luteus]MCV7449391.1 DUF262 domain-containing protein [Micrococcus luteus]UTX34435.1 DUF262 domain-containing protein [Micrococcus luteus]
MTEIPADIDEVENDDILSQVWDRIADGLAALSDASETPEDFGAPTSIFSGAEVDLASDTWMQQFAEVQGWLNFNEDLPTSSPDAFFRALTTELGLDPNSESDAAPWEYGLSARAWERLETRIETAGRLQQEFLEHRQNGMDRSAAAEAWQNAWEENAHDNEPASPEPVNAKADVWHIFQLTKKKLNLAPTYQRGDVWSTKDRQALIESILRGIPLPSIILLRANGSAPHEVVDGKQRLTAILRFVGAHPRAIERVAEAERQHPGNNFMTLFTSDYPKFRRVWGKVMADPLSVTKEDQYYFPFRLRKDDEGGLVGPHLEPLRGKYYTEIKDCTICVGDQELTVDELFEGAPDYKVPVIEYTSAKARQIHEVFKLYNKQGVHLNAEELRNAAYHDVEITRAILFAAGDTDRHADLSVFAPSLMSVSNLDTLGENLKGYQSNVGRYKRTKVLGWMLATLLHRPEQDSLPSTASHIDSFLARVQKNADDPLRNGPTLTRLFDWIVRSVEIHSGNSEIWAPSFKDTKEGLKWQELQLVGSLIGIALAVCASPGDVEDRIEAHMEEIREASGSPSWQRPKKTQTRTQWDYIARIAEGILELLEVDPAAASQAVCDQFGTSGYESLQRSRL